MHNGFPVLNHKETSDWKEGEELSWAQLGQNSIACRSPDAGQIRGLQLTKENLLPCKGNYSVPNSRPGARA